MTERVTIPQLADRIDANKRSEEVEFKNVKEKIGEINSKIARVYVLQGAILVAIISGYVVSLVTR